MPDGVRYLSKELPPLVKDDPTKMITAVHEAVNDRLKHMYVEEGAGSGDSVAGSSLTFSMIHIILTGNEIVTEAWLTQEGFPEASGSGILFIAFEQDATGGRRITWDTNEFHGAGSGTNDQWMIDTRPSRVTVFTFVRNPREGEGNKWWLVSALSSYDAPERES